MGAQVIRGKRVTAIVADNGDIYYQLFAESWGKKYGSREASWSPVTFGKLAHCLEWVLRAAADCEGGMLKGPSGDISPVTFLKQWRKEFALPGTMRTEDVVSAKVGTGLTGIEPKWLDRINLIMEKHGLPDVEDVVSINIRKNPEVLEEILRLQDEDYPWRIGSYCFMSAGDRFGVEPDLTQIACYAPRKCEAVLPALDIKTVEDRPERQHWILKDGNWNCHGWPYSTIGHLIATEALACELANPGSAESAIEQITAMVRNAQGFDPAMSVTVRKPDKSWKMSYFKALALACEQPDGETLMLSVGAIEEKDMGHQLMQLSDCITFNSPQSKPKQLNLVA